MREKMKIWDIYNEMGSRFFAGKYLSRDAALRVLSELKLNHKIRDVKFYPSYVVVIVEVSDGERVVEGIGVGDLPDSSSETIHNAVSFAETLALKRAIASYIGMDVINEIYKTSEDKITDKQIAFLKDLMNERGMEIPSNLESLTRKQASEMIDNLLGGKK